MANDQDNPVQAEMLTQLQEINARLKMLLDIAVWFQDREKQKAESIRQMANNLPRMPKL
jgi:hypothetical protein